MPKQLFFFIIKFQGIKILAEGYILELQSILAPKIFNIRTLHVLKGNNGGVNLQNINQIITQKILKIFIKIGCVYFFNIFFV